MIDIMFLLLLFFMLSADMTQRDLEEVQLPTARTAQPDGKPEERITINVHHRNSACDDHASSFCRDASHWLATIRGEDYTPSQLDERLRQEPPDRKVMIRSDARAPYRLPQRITLACAKAGIYKIDVGAAKVKP